MHANRDVMGLRVVDQGLVDCEWLIKGLSILLKSNNQSIDQHSSSTPFQRAMQERHKQPRPLWVWLESNRIELNRIESNPTKAEPVT